MKPVLKVDNVSYEINGKKILSDISFSGMAGEIIGISGLSGSGKTTLAKIIAGVIKPINGSIAINTEPSETASSNVQLLFQNSVDIINPLRYARDMVHEVTVKHNNKADKETQKKLTDSFLNEARVPSYLWKRKGYELSGGEQQRAAIARIFASMPKLYVFDEPFSAQDPEMEPALMNSIKERAEKYLHTFICISHDINRLKKFCTRYIMIDKGKIEDEGVMSKIEESKCEITQVLLKAQEYKLKPGDFY